MFKTFQITIQRVSCWYVSLFLPEYCITTLRKCCLLFRLVWRLVFDIQASWPLIPLQNYHIIFIPCSFSIIIFYIEFFLTLMYIYRGYGLMFNEKQISYLPKHWALFSVKLCITRAPKKDHFNKKSCALFLNVRPFCLLG
jgi:CDP-diglyceride synthetase